MIDTIVSDYIVVFENIVSDALCDSILEEFNNENEWVKTPVGHNNLDQKIRNAETIPISHADVIKQNTQIRQKLDNDIFECVGYAIKKYNEKFPLCRIEQDSGYELLRYNQGQFYVQHTDSLKLIPRTVSCSLALNDNYEGGEFGFFDQKVKIKIPKGAALMFPSNFMYPHEIIPVVKGTRYSIVTWFV
jgi:predicted 2-oxoglutarate/Fe(II)-dependent dioxygenase YbiX